MLNNTLWLFAFAGSIALAQQLCVSPTITPTPTTIVDDRCPYLLPYSKAEGTVIVSRGNLDPTPGSSHGKDQAGQFAFDFDLEKNKPVLAARGGTVVKVQDHNTECGLSTEFITKANYVIIDHLDGTFAQYMHLQPGVGEFVTEGDTVVVGQIIGMVGNTGYTSCKITAGEGYHLHFQVQMTPAFGAPSIEACFSDVPGDGVPQQGVSYASTQVALVKGGASVTPEVRVESIEISSTETPEAPTATPEPPSATPEPVLIEVFQFDPINETVSGSLPLEEGAKYVVTISGTMSYYNASLWGRWDGENGSNVCEGQAEEFPLIPSAGRVNGPVGKDVEYLFAYPIYTYEGVPSCGTNALSLGHSHPLSLSRDGGTLFTSPEPINRELNTAHSYDYRITGLGHPLVVKLGDVYYEDNYGNLEIKIVQTSN